MTHKHDHDHDRDFDRNAHHHDLTSDWYLWIKS